jgi:hypothetical protein
LQILVWYIIILASSPFFIIVFYLFSMPTYFVQLCIVRASFSKPVSMDNHPIGYMSQVGVIGGLGPHGLVARVPVEHLRYRRRKETPPPPALRV